MVSSEVGVLRGVHVYFIYDDYFIVMFGYAMVGFWDLCWGSDIYGLVMMVDVFGDVFCVILVFYGVVYGFLLVKRSFILVICLVKL